MCQTQFFVPIVFAILAVTVSGSCPAVDICLRNEECPLLPVPKGIDRPVVGPEGYSLTNMRPGVYRFFANTYATLILFKDHRLTLVDFPKSVVGEDGIYLLNQATEEILNGTGPRRIDMVYGHRHIDHIGGANKFFAFVKKKFPHTPIFIWSSRETAEFVKGAPALGLPEPTVSVKDSRVLDIARTLKLQLTVVRAHTESDLAVNVLTSRDGAGIMHFADIFSPGYVPFLDFAVTIDLGGYISAQEKLLDFDFNALSTGHGVIGKKSDIRRNLEYTKDVVRFAEEAAIEVTQEDLIAAGVDLVNDPKAVQFRNIPWAVRTTIELQGAVCLKKLIKKWGCILGSVDVFGITHCKEAFVFNLIGK